MADEYIEPQVKAEAPKVGGLSIAGSKGVSLNPEESANIRQKLMEMIAEREKYQGSWKHIGELGALASAAPGRYSEAFDQFQTRAAARDKELLDMRMGLGQLNTQEAAIAEQKRLAAQQQANFMNLLGGSPAPKPAAPAPAQGALPGVSAPTPAPTPAPAPAQGALPGTSAPAPAQGALPSAPAASPMAPNLSDIQRAGLMQLYQQDPKAATQKLIDLHRQDEMTQRLRAAGVQPGSPEWNNALYLNVAGAGAFTPHDVRKPTGTMQQTPFEAAGAALRPQPTAPAPTTTAPAAAPAATATPAPMAATPAAKPIAPAPAPAPSVGGLAPGSKEALAVEQAKAMVPVEGDTAEAKARAEKVYVPEQASLSTAAEQAPNDLITAARISQNVKKYPTLVGKLANPDIGSALMNVASQGVTMPNGSISFPGINEIATQLDPDMMKLPAKSKEREDRMTAAHQLATDFAMLQLRRSKMMQGQGSVSDNERRLIAQAVGDFTRMTPKGVLILTKAIELEAHNAKEKSALWDQMRGSMPWSQFKSSPQYKALERAQFERTAKALGLSDAKWGD